ncbi:helix-turn-helix domain-containing protein [Cohaesibacter celericrescens]|uniref:XRE family transcriptional regulator n=1 Tax=Cohaesibacter celericrescens TaxID=2067669 RepID=A0A2N5XN76_9HYPH|nr:helix-turn-helix transcriptional regulator [Cohaesibacter celericrescens]PLW76006.1 XRE family transcriptional regulator [Cohaesibacter celericrescens]
MTEFSENLKLLCSYSPSVSQVGRDLKINRSQLNRYLAGDSRPRIALMRKICDYFGVEEYELLLPFEEFAQIVKLRSLDKGPIVRELRQHFDHVMSLNEPRIQNLAGTFWEYHYSMARPGKIIRSLIHFSRQEDKLFYRRLERMGPHDRATLRHHRYQGVALLTGERVFLSDYEYSTGVELTQTVLYPDYAHKWRRLNGIKLGVSADHSHTPCAVRVYLERIPLSTSALRALRQCGLYDVDSSDIPDDIRDMISNVVSGPFVFAAHLYN